MSTTPIFDALFEAHFGPAHRTTTAPGACPEVVQHRAHEQRQPLPSPLQQWWDSAAPPVRHAR
ncbi:hypothetical protein [Saccharothrix sp. Mg75]|uniref:hypothetical protein n=1 Tax=Saccharothrix sp. Mg75 TaxID=3445357 RepID=UPI003EEDF6AF